MPYTHAQDIIQDALFRAGEIAGASEWDGKALDYLNRHYRLICNGTSEFLPEQVEDWWWMRETGVFVIEPVFNTGTVEVISGSTVVTFSSPPAFSVEGWRFRVIGYPDIFLVFGHTGMSPTATLDIPYTGPSIPAAEFQLMKNTYDLASDVASLISPMISFRDDEQIEGVSPERMDFLYPIKRLVPGTPKAFALEDTGTVRFSHAGRMDSLPMRIEYHYKPIVPDLTNDPGSIPRVPITYRPVLADATTFQIMIDKNDDRAGGTSQEVRGLLKSMVAQNRALSVKMGKNMGRIVTRPAYNRFSGPLRTETGLIIG